MEDETGQLIGVVPYDAILEQKILDDVAHSEAIKFLQVVDHLVGPLAAILLSHGGGNRFPVEHHPINQLSSGVIVDGLDVLGGGKADGFVRLRHQVADEDLGRL